MKTWIAFLLIPLYVICSTVTLYGLPEGQSVESGSATFNSLDSQTLEIIAADQTIINFNSFNIAAGETVNFIQPTNSAIVLSRVLGPQASVISGTLTANGILLLTNPHGIEFAASANIAVNSFVASTLEISTNNFLNGNYVFERNIDAGYARVVNEGYITGENIALLGSSAANSGLLLASVGTVHLASGDKTTVSFDQRGFMQVEVNQETSGSVLDTTGKPIKDAVSNTGTVEAGQVIMSAKTASDVFENAVNQQGIVKATGIVEENGVIRIVANKNVQLSGTLQSTTIEVKTEDSINVNAKLDTQGNTNLEADKDINVNADITTENGDLRLFADKDGDGTGQLTQKADTTLYAKEAGNLYVDGSQEMTLHTLKTDSGFIKVGTQRTPNEIKGNPFFAHTQGDFEIIGVASEGVTTTITTSRGDVLKYNQATGCTLQATGGKIQDLTNTPLPGDYLKFEANSFLVNSAATTTHIVKNNGNLYISDASRNNDLITLEAEESGRVTYLAKNNITVESGQDVATGPGVIIQANQVQVIARRFGAADTPLHVDSLIARFTRIDGDIDIRESFGLGTSIMLRGPPEGFGAIIYNSNAHLILEASAGSLRTGPESTVQSRILSFFASESIGSSDAPFYFQTSEHLFDCHAVNGLIYLDSRDTPVTITGNITASGVISLYTGTGLINLQAGRVTSVNSSISLEASSSSINVYGTLSAPQGVVRLWTCGVLDVRGATIWSLAGGYVYNPKADPVVSWVGVGGGGDGVSWGDPLNWSGGNVPNNNTYDVTIDLTGAAVTIAADYVIGTLSLGATNSCSLTLGGTLTLDDAGTLSGNLTIGANGTLNAAGYAISLDGNWSNSGTFNHGNNTVTFTKAAGTQTLDSGGTGAGKTFYDFVFSGAGTLQPVTNHIKVDHNLTFNAGAGAFDNATNDKAISVTGDVTMDNTRVDMGDATWTVSGNWDSAGVTTFNRNESTLTLNGTDKLFTATATMQFRHINVEGTISIGSDIQIKGIATVSGIVTIPSGLAFTLNTSNAELKITENGQIVGQGFVWLSDGVVVTQQDGIFNPSTAVVTRGITLVGATYGGDWTFFHSTTSDKTITFGTAAGQTVIFTGSVTINNNNASGAYTIVNGTYNPNLVFQGGLTLTESAGAITWTKGSGTITLGNNPSDGTQTINFGDKIIEDLIIDASGDIKQLSDGVTTDSLTVTAGTLDVNNQALSVTGNLLVNGGTLDASGASSDLDINGNVQVISGTLSAPAAADDTSFTVGGNWEVSGAGIFTPNAGRVVFDAGDSDNTIITTSAGADDFYDAKFNNILGTWILEDDLTITNDLSIATGTLDVKTGENNSLTVGGDWANTGTFLARNGTVTFNGAGVSILSGSTSFYNFNSSIAGKTLSFTRGTTQTITNDLTLNGSSSNMLIVNDTGAGSVPQLTLQAGAAQNITNVSVTNNDASGGLMLSVQGTSLLSGVTTNWALASSGDSQVSPLTSVSAQSVLRQAEGILYRMPRMTNPFICSDYSFGSPFFIFPAFRLPFLEINYKNLR